MHPTLPDLCQEVFVIFENMCVGAVGVSNLKPDQDEEVAKAGLDYFLANYSA